MTAAKFNIFQRLVRQWDELHPYNAVQAMKLAGPADVDALRATWDEALNTLGLGKVHVNGRGYRHECLNGEAHLHTVRRLPPETSLEDFISEELNRPFGESDTFPFRPFLIEGPDFYWAGVVYQHWVADSASIRLLLREWFVRLYDPAAASHKPLRIADAGYWRLFGPEPARWQLGEGILSSVRWTSRFRRVRRIEGARFGKLAVRFTLHQTPPGAITRLREVSRAHEATVNDVFLAAIAEACNKFVPIQRTSRRQDLALGTIVDLRPMAREDLSDVFGMFLGFTSVICRPRHFQSWDALLSSVAQQSALHKESGVPQASVVRMLAGVAAGNVFSPQKVIGFYRKRCPMAGGISNVNMNRTWAARYSPHPLLDYVRVSPTGPMMPLVFTTTTLGDRLNVGLTYRQAVVPDDHAQDIAAMFLGRLASLTCCGSTKVASC